MFVLDTNVISELRHGKPNQSQLVRAWASDKPIGHLFISAISILELEKGVLALERRMPPQGATLRAWLNAVKTSFTGRILPFTENTATICAALHVPNPKSERDALIAATALEHRMTVVTRNTVDFESTGTTLVNPFNEQQ
jgi:predicted nucleic acid-binding protein